MGHVPDSLIQVNEPRPRFLRDYRGVAKPRHSEAGRRLALLVMELDREVGVRGSQSRVSEKTGLDKGQVTTILEDPDAPRDVTGRTIEAILRGPLKLRVDYFFGHAEPRTYRDYVQGAQLPAGDAAAVPASAERVVLKMITANLGSRQPLTGSEIEQLEATGRALAAGGMSADEVRDHLQSMLSGWRTQAKARAQAKKRPARRR
jgi:hypothetical protein